TKNDENTVIVHNDTIANVYLQSFAGDFKAISTHSLITTTNPCPQTTGINSSKKSGFELNVFPNPFVDELNIEFKNAGETLSVKITDQLGRLILEKEVYQSNLVKVNTSGLATGIYFLTTSSGNKIFTQKIIK
ncbi:MAG TPA: T9SS type A sorting domain-containing protein, partial [Hanamia sp.]